MKIIIELEDVKKLFLDSICNGGLQSLRYSDIVIKYPDKDYDSAKTRLRNNPKRGSEPIYFEDVLVEMVNKAHLIFKDVETEDSEYTKTPTWGLMEKNLNLVLTNEKLKGQALNNIMDVLNETGNADAGTSDSLLQYMLYADIIFG